MNAKSFKNALLICLKITSLSNSSTLFLLFYSMLFSSLVFYQPLAQASSNECFDLTAQFFKKKLVSKWPSQDQKMFDRFLDEWFDSSQKKMIYESLDLQEKRVSSNRAISYLKYAHGLSPREEKKALLDLSLLDQPSLNQSSSVTDFMSLEKKIADKIQKRSLSPEASKRYEELFYGCRSLKPNEINSNAGKDFIRFNLALNLGTLGASYALFNMDEEKNLKWYGELGYDIALTVIFSHFSGLIQTKASDSQMSKALKNYFLGRALGTADIIVYGPLFENESDKAKKRIEELKKNPDYKEKIDELILRLRDQNFLKHFKNHLVQSLKKSEHGISLEVVKNGGVDEFGVDWNNLTHEDLDKPHVQEVLVLAAMAQIYHESKGTLFATGDAGVDRYSYHSLFYALSIPKNLVQNYVTYQILCMEQDRPKLAFTKAMLLNVTANFLSNQVLYDLREKAINQ